MTASHQFAGVLAALVTPFDEALRVDLAAFRQGVEYAVAGGCTGVLIGGHTGEFSALDTDELDELVRAARSQVGSRAVVIQGVYAESTARAVLNGQLARDSGADGILVIPPWLFGLGGAHDREVVYEFYKTVTDTVALPAVAFCYGPASGFHPSVIAAISELKHVVAVKVGGPVHHYEATLRAVGARASVLCCADLSLYPCLAAGGDGVMAALAAIAPHWCVEMFECVQRGDGIRGRQINDTLFTLTQMVFREPYLRMPLRVKAVLETLGVLDLAQARPPIQPLSVWERGDLTKTTHASGLFAIANQLLRAEASGRA